MGIVSEIKDAAKIAQQIGNIELYEKIHNLQSQVEELMQQVRHKNQQLQSEDQEIAKLKEALAVKKDFFRDKCGFFHSVDETGKPTGAALCPICIQDNQKEIPVDTSGYRAKCPKCKADFDQGKKSAPLIKLQGNERRF